MKGDEGYPNLSIPLYLHGAELPLTEVTRESHVATVSLTLGPKAGVLVVRVVDKATGKPVSNPGFLLRRAQNPDISLSTGPDARSRLLIP